MFLYLFTILLVFAIWKVKGYFSFNEPINLSKTSTPLIKTSISIAFMSQGLMIYEAHQTNKFFIIFLRQTKFLIISEETLRSLKVPT